MKVVEFFSVHYLGRYEVPTSETRDYTSWTVMGELTYEFEKELDWHYCFAYEPGVFYELWRS